MRRLTGFIATLVDSVFLGMKVHTSRILAIFFSVFTFGTLASLVLGDSLQAAMVAGAMWVVGTWEVLLVTFILSEKEE